MIKKMNWFVRVLTFGQAMGISLFPFGIYILERYLHYQSVQRHEKTHWQQQIEMCVVSGIISLITGIVLLLFGVFSWWILLLLIFPFLFFYIWYLIEWIIKIFVNGNQAYQSLSFEREANAFEDDSTYLERRKHFAWLKFISK